MAKLSFISTSCEYNQVPQKELHYLVLPGCLALFTIALLPYQHPGVTSRCSWYCSPRDAPGVFALFSVMVNSCNIHLVMMSRVENSGSRK